MKNRMARRNINEFATVLRFGGRIEFDAEFAQRPRDRRRNAVGQQDDAAAIGERTPDECARIGRLEVSALDAQDFRIVGGRELI